MAETIYNSSYTGEQIDSAVAWLLKHAQDHICGGAVSGTTIATPSDPTYWYVGAGTYTCGNDTITIPSGNFGIISYNGATWSSTLFPVAEDKADVINIGGAKKLQTKQAPLVNLYNIEPIASCSSNNKLWFCTDGHLYYRTNGSINADGKDYDLNTPAFTVYYYGDKTYKWTGSAFAPIGGNVEIIDNLSTGGSDKALSAEQGKLLSLRIDQMASSKDYELTYDDNTETYNLTRVVPLLNVTQLAALSASNKSGTFKVSGTNLKGAVTISISASGWQLRVGNGVAASSVTLSPTNDTLAETTVTAIYSGSSDSINNTITIASPGAASKTVAASYTVVAGPTIFADTTKTVSAIAGGSGTAIIEVTASNLTSGITVTKSGENASKFSVSPLSLGTSGGTLTVTFNPVASDTSNQSAKLTLSSAGATPVEITLTGIVRVPSLTVYPTSLNLQSASGSQATGTINVKGSNLLNDVVLTVSGSGFSVSPSRLTAASVNAAENTGIDVTITRSNSATATTGTLTITSGSMSRTVTLNWEEQVVETEAVGSEVVRNVAYKTVADIQAGTPNLWAHFKILTTANGSTPGTVSITTSKTLNGHYWVESSDDPDYVCPLCVIPDSITINGHQYDVTQSLNQAFNSKSFDLFIFNSKMTTIGTSPFMTWIERTSVINKMVFNGVMAQSVTGGNPDINEIDFSAAQSALGNLLDGAKPLTNGITLRKTDDVVSIGSGAFANVTGPITVYVPNDLINSYKTATNWSTYFNSGKVTFVAIQEN